MVLSAGRFELLGCGALGLEQLTRVVRPSEMAQAPCGQLRQPHDAVQVRKQVEPVTQFPRDRQALRVFLQCRCMIAARLSRCEAADR